MPNFLTQCFVSFCFLLSFRVPGSTADTAAGRPPVPPASSVPVPDPTLGLMGADLRVPAGWKGTAHIDRTSDPLSYAVGTVAADLRSPDGQASIQILAVPFHTYGGPRQVVAMMPNNPLAQRNAANVRFTSTEELLNRAILPALQLTGTPVYRERLPEAARQQLAQQQRDVPNPIFDAALVLFHQGGRDLLVRGVTTGGSAGTDRENTMTHLMVVTAPEGKALGVMSVYDALPSAQPSAAWQEADSRYLAEWRQTMEAQYAEVNRQIQNGTRSILAQGQANIRAMQARGAERDRAFAIHEQQVTDQGANFRGYLSGTDVHFKWCSANDVQYTTNDTRSPGAGYRRCD